MNPINALIARAIADAGRGAASQLASDTEVNQSTVARWMSGQIVPEPKRWATIERSLKLPNGSLRRAHDEHVRQLHESGSERLVAEIAQLGESIAVLADRVQTLERRLDLTDSQPSPASRRPARSTPPGKARRP